MKNQRFGKLVVIEQVENNPWGHTQWKCRCDCGRETIVIASNLKRGNTKGCGCGKYDPKPTIQQRMRKRPFEYLYGEMKRSAIRRKVLCSVTYEDFLLFTKIKTCHYCGNEILWEAFYPPNGKPVYNLDRKDNTLGYTADNCVVCCPMCNFMKGTKNEADFLDHASQIHIYQTSKISSVSSPS